MIAQSYPVYRIAPLAPTRRQLRPSLIRLKTSYIFRRRRSASCPRRKPFEAVYASATWSMTGSTRGSSGSTGRSIPTRPSFEAEIERIFEGGWVFLCHESQVEKPGDYFATEIGRQPVFVMRQQDGSLRLLHQCLLPSGRLADPAQARETRVRSPAVSTAGRTISADAASGSRTRSRASPLRNARAKASTSVGSAPSTPTRGSCSGA